MVWLPGILPLELSGNGRKLHHSRMGFAAYRRFAYRLREEGKAVLNMIDGAVVSGFLLVGFLALLVLAGAIADYILPNIEVVERWMHSLPNWADEGGEK